MCECMYVCARNLFYTLPLLFSTQAAITKVFDTLQYLSKHLLSSNLKVSKYAQQASVFSVSYWKFDKYIFKHLLAEKRSTSKLEI